MRLETFAVKHRFEIRERQIGDLPEEMQEQIQEEGWDSTYWLDHDSSDCEPAAALYRKGDRYTLKNIWGFKDQDGKEFSVSELKALLKTKQNIE